MNSLFRKISVVFVCVIVFSLSFYVTHASILGLQSKTTSEAPLSLSFASINYGPIGTQVTLTGTGFSTKSNTVNLGKKYKIRSVASKESTELTFKIPKNAAVGRYDVSVTSGGKKSESVPFMVTVEGATLPVIEKIGEKLIASNPVVKFGQEITLTGKNFTAKDNIISTNFGIVKGISSKDGKTLTFTLPFPEYLVGVDSEIQKKWLGAETNKQWPLWIRVVNVNGPSVNPENSKMLVSI